MPLRINRTTIKMEETSPGIEGGQGIVVIGTLSLPDALKDILAEVKVAVKKLEWNRDDVEESAKFLKVSPVAMTV